MDLSMALMFHNLKAPSHRLADSIKACLRSRSFFLLHLHTVWDASGSLLKCKCNILFSQLVMAFSQNDYGSPIRGGSRIPHRRGRQPPLLGNGIIITTSEILRK